MPDTYLLGVLGGILLCLSIGVAEAFTLYVISKMAERYQVTSNQGDFNSLILNSLMQSEILRLCSKQSGQIHGESQ